MWFEQVLFFIAAIGAIAGALGVVMLRNPFFSVLALVAHLLSLAVLFLLLRAEFVAAAQVVVYAGAVMVLYVFVVAYIGGVRRAARRARGGAVAAALGPLFAARPARRAVIARARLRPLGARRARRRRRRPRLRHARRRSASCCSTRFLLAVRGRLVPAAGRGRGRGGARAPPARARGGGRARTARRRIGPAASADRSGTQAGGSAPDETIAGTWSSRRSSSRSARPACSRAATRSSCCSASS